MEPILCLVWRLTKRSRTLFLSYLLTCVEVQLCTTTKSYLDCFRNDEDITFEQAVKVLRDELHYPEERALHFVKRFDRNNDGHLSTVNQ